MQLVIRRSGKVSIFIGWMLSVMGVLAIATIVILAIVLELPWMLYLLFAILILVVGAAVNFWIGYRARLEVTPEVVRWCGFVGRAHELPWRNVRMIHMPAPGSPGRLAAVAELLDGRIVEIFALWTSPTSPARLSGPPDLSRERQVLVQAHQAFLARAGAGGPGPGWPGGWGR